LATNVTGEQLDSSFERETGPDEGGGEGRMSLDAADFIVVSPAGSCDCVVRARGEIDIYTGPALRDVLRDVVAAGPSQVVIDMAEVSFIDSSGLSVIIGAYKRAQDSGIDLVLRSPTARVVRLLEMTGLNRALTVVSAPESSEPPGSDDRADQTP
jgi:anti-sigma B factor antagonist